MNALYAFNLRYIYSYRYRFSYNKCARCMCRVNLHHTFRHHITSSSFIRRLGLLDIDNYSYNRFLRWTGYVARMPMSRAPRQLLTSWVAHSRPVGCPQMTWGRASENALKSKGISAFPRSSMSGSPLPRTGRRSGDSRLTPIPNPSLLMPGG